jgi:hypothetical protein
VPGNVFRSGLLGLVEGILLISFFVPARFFRVGHFAIVLCAAAILTGLDEPAFLADPWFWVCTIGSAGCTTIWVRERLMARQDADPSRRP